MSLPLFSSFFSALNVFADSSTAATYKPGRDSVVRTVQVLLLFYRIMSEHPQSRALVATFHLFIIFILSAGSSE